jgi:hypothetical protein
MKHKDVEDQAGYLTVFVEVLRFRPGDNAVVLALNERLQDTLEKGTNGDSDQPNYDECNSLIEMSRLMLDVGRVSEESCGMIEIRVLARDVREGMVTDDVLVHPRIRSAEHKADVHAEAVFEPAL